MGKIEAKRDGKPRSEDAKAEDWRVSEGRGGREEGREEDCGSVLLQLH